VTLAPLQPPSFPELRESEPALKINEIESSGKKVQLFAYHFEFATSCNLYMRGKVRHSGEMYCYMSDEG
jgi:hypothetical protein